MRIDPAVISEMSCDASPLPPPQLYLTEGANMCQQEDPLEQMLRAFLIFIEHHFKGQNPNLTTNPTTNIDMCIFFS